MITKILLVLTYICFTLTIAAQTKSEKRGACMSNLNRADFEALHDGLSWFYDWRNVPSFVGVSASDEYNIEYCPMIWGTAWNPDVIRKYVINHPNCKYLLTFNEPNFEEQANLTPQQASVYWHEIKALANELNLKLISPALNYSYWDEWNTPQKWLDAFFELIPIEDVDGIAIHCYMGYSDALINFVKEYINYYKKPVWLTEFCSWDDRHGTPPSDMKKNQREYMIDTFNFLETEPNVKRYAWFMAKTSENNAVPHFPWMQLLNGNNGDLTEIGKIFNNMSSYDNNFYHDTKSRIQANHYLQMKGIYLEETTDIDGIIDVYDFSAGDFLEYNIDISVAGVYHLFVRHFNTFDTQISILIDGETKTQILLPATPNNKWATHKFSIDLLEGKQKIRLFCQTGSAVKINWLNISTNENAETVDNDLIEYYSPFIYPNPVSDKFYTSCEVKKIDIYSLHGQLLLSENRREVNIDTFSKGLYLGLLTDKNGEKNRVKIVKL